MIPETEAREALEKALKETYAAEGFPVVPGKLHRSVGDEGGLIGVSVERTQHERDALVQEMRLIVQLYGPYNKEINRYQPADPKQIEEYAERFREKLKSGIDPRTSGVWYFMLERTDFPGDPLGNITRYEMHITAHGTNTALLETK